MIVWSEKTKLGWKIFHSSVQISPIVGRQNLRFMGLRGDNILYKTHKLSEQMNLGLV